MKQALNKLMLLCLLLTTGSGSLVAQRSDWQWGKYATGAHSDVGKCLGTDNNGHIYVAGSYESATFSFQQALNLTNNNPGVSREDIFIAKYDTLGNLIWAKSINGDYEDVVVGIAVEANGNFYLTGYFNSPLLTMGSMTLTHGNTGYYEMFIAKYDSSGTAIWAERFTGTSGSTNNVKSFGIAIDSVSNVYVTGMFECYYFNLQSVTLTNSSTGTYISDLFVAKFDSSGTIIWAQRAGGGFSEVSYDIAVNSNGVYIAGWYSSSNVVFGNDTLPFIGTTNFIAKYDHSGNAVWGKSIGGTTPVSTGVTPSNRPTICPDNSGALYTTGVFNNSFVIFAGDTVDHPSASEGYYLAKYDDNGNALWGKGGSGYPGGLRVAPTSSEVYLSVTGVQNYELLNTNFRSYVILCNTSGDTITSSYVDGTSSSIYDILVDSNDDLFATGYYNSSNVYFSITQLSPFYNYNGSYDFFVARLATGSVMGIDAATSSMVFNLYPNPAADYIYVDTEEHLKFQITNSSGAVVKDGQMQNNSINVIDLLPGLYFIRFTDGMGNSTVSKFIRQ